MDRVAASSSELDAIRRGADRILAGASPASVAAQWSRLGLPSCSGRAGWTSRDVRRVLTHPRNLDRGTLSAETLCRLLAILEDPAGTPPTAGGLLSGVLECGTCGALCGSGGPDVYSCPDGHAAVDRAPADQFVDSVVRSHLPPARHTGFGRHPKQIRKDLDAMRAAIDRTARAFAARRLSPAHAAQVSKALVGSIDDLRAELDEATAPVSLRPAGWGWDELDLPARRTLLLRYAKVTVHADRLPDSTGRPGLDVDVLVDHAWQRVAGRTRADGES